MPLAISVVSHDELVDVVHAAGRTVPVEQTPAWARYDDVLPGRQHWRVLLVSDGDEPLAVMSLTEFAGRSLVQLWAKSGPVWLVDEPTAEQERALRLALVPYLRSEHPRAALVRLHATHPAADLVEPIIEVFYDRTLILDITRSEDELMARMSKNGRRDLRYGLKNEDLVFADETDITDEAFATEVFPVFCETAERGEFDLRPPQFYLEMIRQLGPEICRLYTVRLQGKVIAWAFVTIVDGEARYFYAATSAAARSSFAAYRMVWGCILEAKARGARTFDFMGLSSPRQPGLASLDGFKLKFDKEGGTDVPGPWDVIVRPGSMRAYRAIAGAKGFVRRVRRDGPGAVRRALRTARSVEWRGPRRRRSRG